MIPAKVDATLGESIDERVINQSDAERLKIFAVELWQTLNET